MALYYRVEANKGRYTSQELGNCLNVGTSIQLSWYLILILDGNSENP